MPQHQHCVRASSPCGAMLSSAGCSPQCTRFHSRDACDCLKELLAMFLTASLHGAWHCTRHAVFIAVLALTFIASPVSLPPPLPSHTHAHTSTHPLRCGTYSRTGHAPPWCLWPSRACCSAQQQPPSWSRWRPMVGPLLQGVPRAGAGGAGWKWERSEGVVACMAQDYSGQLGSSA
jgi:hypothetical protein